MMWEAIITTIVMKLVLISKVPPRILLAFSEGIADLRRSATAPVDICKRAPTESCSAGNNNSAHSCCYSAKVRRKCWYFNTNTKQKHSFSIVRGW